MKFFRRILVLLGFAAAVGYVTGLLTAPKSGKATREDMRELSQKSRTEAEHALQIMRTELNDILAEARTRSEGLKGSTAQGELESLVEAARQARDKATTIIHAVKAGDSEDEDLRIAVSKARSVLNHLREYLKK